MKILIISNGYGEDQIACNIINTFKDLTDFEDASFLILPLVGEGEEYQNLGYALQLKNKKLPSGGFIRNLGALFKDISHGLLSQCYSHFQAVAKIANQVDLTICVGDVYCLLVGSYKNPSPKYFLPTAKSHLFMRHSKIEILLIKKFAKLVFPRDELTTESLIASGVAAKFMGNPMMDRFKIIKPKSTFIFPKNAKIIGLLPGSREEAYPNLAFILKIISALEVQDNLYFILAKAKSLNLNSIEAYLANSEWQINNKKDRILNKKSNLELIITEDFNSAIHSVDFFIGLAGTANEQAVYSGKKVLCFEGFGPQSSKQRFQEQEMLLGSDLIFVKDRNIREIVNYINNLLRIDYSSQKKLSSQRLSASLKICREILYSLDFQSL